MKARLPLFGKVLCIAFLNLALLLLFIAAYARVQFNLSAESVLLAPAQSRILSMAHALALDLDESQPPEWDNIVARYSGTHRVAIFLVDEEGAPVAGTPLELPRKVSERIPRRERRPDPPRRDPPRPGEEGPPPRPEPRRGEGAPPLFLLATSSPVRYWAAARIPVRRDRAEEPKPGTLILMSPSLLASTLFFDPTPWLTIGAGVIAVSVACWFPFIRGVTRSIAQMTRAAERIAEGHFEVHVSGERRDEIGQLGSAINRMAARLSGFVNGQKRFLAGIAHELCNPIATVQFALGILERNAAEQDRPHVGDIQEEVERMSALVNELLSFSRAGMAGKNLKLRAVGVAATVGRVVEREMPPEQPFEMKVDEKMAVLADPEYLFRAISNVVRNAIRYAGSAGPIRVSARTEAGTVHITISDQGQGVPEDALEEIFEPFYRLDTSRDRRTGGVGMGLAIVKSCIEACDGTVVCRNRKPTGLEVEILLPVAEL